VFIVYDLHIHVLRASFEIFQNFFRCDRNQNVVHCFENSVAFVCESNPKPMLGEAAADVMRENVKREVVTHHALRITCLASRANLAARHFHWYRRGVARRRTALKIE